MEFLFDLLCKGHEPTCRILVNPNPDHTGELWVWERANVREPYMYGAEHNVCKGLFHRICNLLRYLPKKKQGKMHVLSFYWACLDLQIGLQSRYGIQSVCI